MKFANINGRLALVREDGAVDVSSASGGDLPADPTASFERWSEVLAWAGRAAGATAASWATSDLGAPSPAPRQIFGIGLNYAPHAAESGFAVPEHPFVFTKTFPSLAGPAGDLVIRSENVDWEVELVVVIGRTARDVPVEDAWSYIAGLTGGQDFSDRAIQGRLGPNSQPTLGKSLPGFGPTGPLLVTADEFEDPDDIELACSVNGEVVQRGRTSELIFDIAALVAYLSDVTVLLPGDLIFTGTPAGVGYGRTPPRYLVPGDVVETTITGIGTLRHRVVRSDR